VAYIQGLANQHHRNAEWAADAVKNSVNVPAEKAVELHVADLLSSSTAHLLTAVDGRTVEKRGHTLTLHTAGAPVVSHEMGFAQGLLHALADPQIAYLLMLLAILAIGVEITHPGAILPGVTGAIAIVLALVSFESLPVSYAGLALVFFGVVLFAVDIKASTHGVLTTGGILAVALGGFLILDATTPYLEPSLWAVLVPPLSVGGLMAFIVAKAIAVRRRRPVTGIQLLIGAEGEARADLSPAGGTVFVDGALWQAFSSAPIPRGARVRITGVDGLRLTVETA
jgi:membrane-bound serine protease (ClpP class)